MSPPIVYPLNKPRAHTAIRMTASIGIMCRFSLRGGLGFGSRTARDTKAEIPLR
jgi:hypothetical protein